MTVLSLYSNLQHRVSLPNLCKQICYWNNKFFIPLFYFNKHRATGKHLSDLLIIFLPYYHFNNQLFPAFLRGSGYVELPCRETSYILYSVYSVLFKYLMNKAIKDHVCNALYAIHKDNNTRTQYVLDQFVNYE